MTLNDFVSKYGKAERTVVGWLNKRLVPGAYILADTQEWYIPEDARPPYMKKKPKNGGDAMYKSIANAVSEGCAVFPELYNMTKQRFDVYINQLIAAGIITSYIAEGITYYETTFETAKFAKMPNKAAMEIMKQFIEAYNKGTAQGVTEGMLSGASA